MKLELLILGAGGAGGGDPNKSSSSKPQAALGKNLVSNMPGCGVEGSIEITEPGGPRLLTHGIPQRLFSVQVPRSCPLARPRVGLQMAG